MGFSDHLELWVCEPRSGLQAFATVDIGLVMPSAGDAAHAAAGRGTRGSNTFKFFEPLRLQLRGAPEAVRTAMARDRATPGRDATAPYTEARIRAVMLATTLLLTEARKKVRLPLSYLDTAPPSEACRAVVMHGCCGVRCAVAAADLSGLAPVVCVSAPTHLSPSAVAPDCGGRERRTSSPRRRAWRT